MITSIMLTSTVTLSLLGIHLKKVMEPTITCCLVQWRV